MHCQGVPVDNVYKFVYLGGVLAADANQDYDIDKRIAMVMSRCGRLRSIFDSQEIGPWLKIRLYKASVCSLLTYGCESWTLTDRVVRKLNHTNSLMLSSITGRTVQEEARSTTSSFDLVRNIRVRRFRWLGEILRMHPDRLIFKSIVFQYVNGHGGSLTMDVPQHNDLTHLIQIAREKMTWKSLESNIPSHLRRGI